jgi:hypothetical protein
VGALDPRASGTADAVEVLAPSFGDELTAGVSAVVIRTFAAGTPEMGRQLLRDLDNVVARESGERRQERRLLRPRRARDLPASNCRFAASLGTSPSFFPPALGSAAGLNVRSAMDADRSGKNEQADFPRRAPRVCKITPLWVAGTGQAQ